MKIIPLVAGSLGAIPKHFGNRLKQIGITAGTAQVQKTVLLGTARIFRKVLEILGYSNGCGSISIVFSSIVLLCVSIIIIVILTIMIIITHYAIKAILSDGTLRRSTVDREDLKPYWKLEKKATFL